MDTTMIGKFLAELSRLYHISINEILSGQRLNDEEYKSNAEENITAVLEGLEANREAERKHWKRVFYIFLYGSCLATLLIIEIVSRTLLSTDGFRWAGVIIILLALLMMVTFNTLNICLYISKDSKD